MKKVGHDTHVQTRIGWRKMRLGHVLLVEGLLLWVPETISAVLQPMAAAAKER